MSDPAETQRLADRDRVVRPAMLALTPILSDPRLHATTQADHDRIIVEAAIGYLLHSGMIALTPEGTWPEWMEIGLPDYLVPDIDAANAKLDRYNQIARDAR